MDKLREVVRFMLVVGTLVSIAMNISNQVDAINAGEMEQIYLAITTIECTIVGLSLIHI